MRPPPPGENHAHRGGALEERRLKRKREREVFPQRIFCSKYDLHSSLMTWMGATWPVTEYFLCIATVPTRSSTGIYYNNMYNMHLVVNPSDIWVRLKSISRVMPLY